MAIGTGVFHPRPGNKAYKKAAFYFWPFKVCFYGTWKCSNEILIFFRDFETSRRPGRPLSRGVQACESAADKETAAIASPLPVTKLLSSKGYGYQPAQQDPFKYHGVGAFEVESGPHILRNILKGRAYIRHSSFLPPAGGLSGLILRP